MVETWRDIEYFVGLYQVSNFGRIRSLDRWINDSRCKRFIKGKILKPKKERNGYLRVDLWKNGKVKQFYIHRLMWEAFNGEIPEGLQVNHINEIKTDNFVFVNPDGSVDLQKSNLNLMSPKENCNWGTRNKKVSEKHIGVFNTKCSDPVLQLTLDRQLVKEWPSAREAERNGFHHGSISACCSGKLKQHKGYIWIKKAAS